MNETCKRAAAYTSGSLHFCASLRPPQSGDGVLHVQVGDYIVLEYSDEAPTSRVTTEATLILQSYIADLALHPRYCAIGDNITITMTDNDFNLSPHFHDTARVVIATIRGGQEEGGAIGGSGNHDLVLQETAISSGVFTGLARTEQRASSPTTAASSLSTSGLLSLYVSEGDDVIVTVYDVEPAPTNRSAKVAVANPVTISLSTTLVQGRLDLAIRDFDTVKEKLSQSMGASSIYYEARTPLNITASISWLSGGGTFTLIESLQSGLALGTFKATLYLGGPLAFISDIEQIKEGMTITVTYASSQMQGRIVQATAVVKSSFAAFIRTTSEIVETGRALHVEVFDIDMNTDSSVIEQLAISISATGTSTSSNRSTDPTAGTKAVLLQETGPSTSSFTARIHTLPEGSPQTKSIEIPGLAEVTVDEGQSLVLTYSDQAPQRNVSTKVLLAPHLQLQLTLSALGGSNVVTLNEREKKRNIHQGGTFEIRVVDPTQNLFPNALDPVTISVRVSVGNMAAVPILQTHIMLEESGPNTGVFIATVEVSDRLLIANTSTAAVDRGMSEVTSLTIVAEAGDVITVSYGNAPNERQVSRTVYPSVVGVPSLRGSGNAAAISYSPNLEVWPFAIGSIVSLTVVDADLNEDVAAAEAATVSVAVSSNGAVAHVTVTEQSEDSSIFTGILRTRLQGPTGGAMESLLQQGVLPVAPGSILTAIYQDAAPINRIKSVMFARATMTGILNLSPSLLKSGGVLTIFLKDSDLDADSQSAESTSVVVTCGANLDSETLQLLETSNTSGIFTGSVPTIQTVVNGVHNSGWLNVRPGASILATYKDDEDGGLVETSATTKPATIANLSASRRVAVGESLLSVTVIDGDVDVSTGIDFAIGNLSV